MTAFVQREGKGFHKIYKCIQRHFSWGDLGECVGPLERVDAYPSPPSPEGLADCTRYPGSATDCYIYFQTYFKGRGLYLGLSVLLYYYCFLFVFHFFDGFSLYVRLKVTPLHVFRNIGVTHLEVLYLKY